jgi:hypothetical protein
MFNYTYPCLLLCCFCIAVIHILPSLCVSSFSCTSYSYKYAYSAIDKELGRKFYKDIRVFNALQKLDCETAYARGCQTRDLLFIFLRPTHS